MLFILAFLIKIQKLIHYDPCLFIFLNIEKIFYHLNYKNKIYSHNFLKF